jgi:hypothetical protein
VHMLNHCNIPRMLRTISLFFLMVFSGTMALHAQVNKPVTWKFSVNRIDEKKIAIVADAIIEKPWHLYSTIIPEGGPIATSLVFEESSFFKPTGGLTEEPKAVLHDDEAFQMKIGYFSGNARITQLAEVTSVDAFKIKGYVEFMACNDEQCLPTRSDRL